MLALTLAAARAEPFVKRAVRDPLYVTWQRFLSQLHHSAQSHHQTSTASCEREHGTATLLFSAARRRSPPVGEERGRRRHRPAPAELDPARDVDRTAGFTERVDETGRHPSFSAEQPGGPI